MTEAGARISTSIAHSAIFLNISFIPGYAGEGYLIPARPFPSKPSAGVIKPFLKR
jgi:hypothetical protein